MDELRFLLDCLDSGSPMFAKSLSEKRILRRFSLIITSEVEAMIIRNKRAS